jgi:transcription antitermination factor NusG
MSTSNQLWEVSNQAGILRNHFENWYAVLTYARHEKVVAGRLRDKGVTTFLPTVTEIHRWSDRKKVVEVPLFSCYLFVKLAPTNEELQKVLQIGNLLGFAGSTRLGTPIPSEQIEAVRILVRERLQYRVHPFLKTGQRVRVCSGALEGLEGILVSRKGESTLVLSVDAMQRSLSVQIDGYDLEAV